MPRCAVFQIVRKDLAFLNGATHIIDGQPRLFAETLGNEQFRAIYRPTNVQVGDNGEVSFPEFRLFVECCFEVAILAMLVDEAHLCAVPAIYRHASRRPSYLDGMRISTSYMWRKASPCRSFAYKEYRRVFTSGISSNPPTSKVSVSDAARRE